MTDAMAHDAVDALIVGAGPYGLSIGAHAGALGLRVRVVGRPMRFWDEQMPQGMLLKSEPFASGFGGPVAGLSFLDYRAEQGDSWERMGRPIPLETFVGYGRWYADRMLPPSDEATVQHVDRTPEGYRAILSTGEVLHASAVVVAVGVGGFAYTPEELEGLSPELATHSSVHRDLGVFAGRRVAVIGAGQSALETAALLGEAGAHPIVIARTARLKWNAGPVTAPSLADRLRGPDSGLGTGWRTWVWSERPQAVRYLPRAVRRHIVRTTLGPAGSWWLRDRLAPAEVWLGHRVVAAGEEGDGVRLDLLGPGGERAVLAADHVIAATGYRPDLHRLPLLSTRIAGRLRTVHRSPALSASFESSLPGLYFAGLTAAATFGPVMRFVHGAGFAARRISAHMAANRVAPSNQSRPASVRYQ